MLIISVTKFRKHLGKYSKLAEKEEIIITSFGKIIFKTVPISSLKVEMAKSLIGILPKNASFGNNLHERE